MTPDSGLARSIVPRRSLLIPIAINVPAYLLLAMPFLQAICFIYAFGINIGWEDQFFVVPPLFEKWYAGDLSFWDFWSQHHVEHRHFFPHLVEFFLGLLTRWNTLAELFIFPFLLLLMLGMQIYALRRVCGPRSSPWLFVPLALAVFSLRQHHNLLMGHAGLVYGLTGCGALAALFFLSLMDVAKWRVAKFAAALASATVATFSAVQGLLVWPVGFLQLFAIPIKKRSRTTLIGVWTGVGLIEIVAYFCSYSRTKMPLGFSWEYLAISAGGALFPLEEVAVAAGGLLFVIAVVACVWGLPEIPRRRCTLWLAMVVFALLFELQLTVGRSGAFAPRQAGSSRYATLSLFLVIGVYGILSYLSTEKFSHRVSAVWGAVTGFLILGVLLSMAEGYYGGTVHLADQRYHRFVFHTADTQPDSALHFADWDDLQEIKHNLAVVKEHRLNLFSDARAAAEFAIPDPPPPTLAAVPYVHLTGLRLISEGRSLLVAGYALAPGGKDLAGGVVLEIDGKPYRAYYGQPPVSLAGESEAIPVPASSRFVREFSKQQLPAGQHRFVIKVLTKDGKAYFAPWPELVTIPPWPT